MRTFGAGILAALFAAGAICLAVPAGAKGLRKVVAVSRFENKSSYASGGEAALTNGLVDQLTDALIQSGQFVVLTRQTLSDVVGEQDLAASGRFRASKSAQTGKLVSAQILVEGAVTEFESRSSGGLSGISLGGFRLGTQRESAHVGLMIRLVDTTTGEVIASKRAEGSASAGGLKVETQIKDIEIGSESFKKTPLGKATQIAIDEAVEFIASSLREVPFQARVLKVSGDEVTIGAGEKHGVKAGDEFRVVAENEELVDPDTGERLGHEEQEIGSVKVYEVREKYCKAKTVGEIPGIKRGDLVRAE
ncbi:MAG: hypothetical protein Kow00128_18100 [Deltaproteobacteria bacterium]